MLYGNHMLTITATVTDTNARRIVGALRHSTDPGAQALVAELKAHLGKQPVHCFHCKQPFTAEADYAAHLAVTHHYLTNADVEARGDKPEDTAENTAWNAFHSL